MYSPEAEMSTFYSILQPMSEQMFGVWLTAYGIQSQTFFLVPYAAFLVPLIDLLHGFTLKREA